MSLAEFIKEAKLKFSSVLLSLQTRVFIFTGTIYRTITHVTNYSGKKQFNSHTKINKVNRRLFVLSGRRATDMETNDCLKNLVTFH